MRFCVKCGTPYEASDNFCNSCGRQTQKTGDQVSETTQPSQVLFSPPAPITTPAHLPPLAIAAVESAPTKGEPAAPFGRFTLFALLGMTCCSTLGFIAMDDLSRGRAYLIPFSIVVCIALAICAKQIRDIWERIGVFERSNSSCEPLRGVIARRLSFFLALSIAGGMTIGGLIGKSGAETEAYVADLALYRQIGDRISQARDSAEKTIAGQLDMYRKIEPDVVALKPVVDRLKDENHEYATKYPASRETNASSAQAFEKTGKRDELLVKQIAVAKEIGELQTEDAQLALYREKMLPILADEDRIDGR
jgi:hypothetical protein